VMARNPKARKAAKAGRSPKATSGQATTEPRLSRQRKPAQMPADDWQRTLRRQFARDQAFELVNLSRDKPAPIFSDYSVFNPDSGGRYRVSIRGTAPGDNLCTCLDYATNDLGTCKHIEFALVRLAARRGARPRCSAATRRCSARSTCTRRVSARCVSAPAASVRPRS
jgi:hypothetical protein